MHRVLIFCLMLALAFAAPAMAHTAPEEITDMQNTLNARFIVENWCEYTVFLKNKSTPVKLKGAWLGTGFFAEHESEPHVAFTAAHVVECESALQDLKLPNGLAKEDIASFEVKNVVFAVYNDVRYAASIIGKGHNGLGNLDVAVLNVILPKNLPHYHIPILRDYGAYNVKSPVTIMGFIPEVGLWRVKTAVLEELGEDVFRVSTPACGGMSGGPVMLWHNGKHRVIGIVIATITSEQCGKVDTTFATRLTKTLMDKIDSKIAPK